ncbi:hypothetical protein BpHYR1_006193 [Brachionus plicatilis]|uniref:Uncharacterized protein n=1 Tax=Brachionus plicatilis TaxID=10195 RepID=A0A3M7PWH2_BRAPC|nr:hypothetical protein BpHYR1_006193 [Brachionus plicatilis]
MKQMSIVQAECVNNKLKITTESLFYLSNNLVMSPYFTTFYILEILILEWDKVKVFTKKNELKAFLRNDSHQNISKTDGSQTLKCNECQLEISAENEPKGKREYF